MIQSLLLVEDNEDDVFLMKRAMKSAGLTNPLQVVDSGQAAVDYLRGDGIFADREQYPLPCLILLDLKLPLIPGLDVLKWIREQSAFERIIVVVLTSSSMDVDIDQAYRLGANSFLVKPPTPERLVEMVKMISDYWLKLNRPSSQYIKFSAETK